MSQYNLIISPRAEERIDSLLDYLLKEWGFHKILTIFNPLINS